MVPSGKTESEVFRYGSTNHKMAFVSEMQRHLQTPYTFGKTEFNRF